MGYLQGTCEGFPSENGSHENALKSILNALISH